MDLNDYLLWHIYGITKEFPKSLLYQLVLYVWKQCVDDNTKLLGNVDDDWILTDEVSGKLTAVVAIATVVSSEGARAGKVVLGAMDVGAVPFPSE